jgi:hypothetical protein
VAQPQAVQLYIAGSLVIFIQRAKNFFQFRLGTGIFLGLDRFVGIIDSIEIFEVEFLIKLFPTHLNFLFRRPLVASFIFSCFMVLKFVINIINGMMVEHAAEPMLQPWRQFKASTTSGTGLFS